MIIQFLKNLAPKLGLIIVIISLLLIQYYRVRFLRDEKVIAMYKQNYQNVTSGLKVAEQKAVQTKAKEQQSIKVIEHYTVSNDCTQAVSWLRDNLIKES